MRRLGWPVLDTTRTFRISRHLPDPHADEALTPASARTRMAQQDSYSTTFPTPPRASRIPVAPATKLGQDPTPPPVFATPQIVSHLQQNASAEVASSRYCPDLFCPSQKVGLRRKTGSPPNTPPRICEIRRQSADSHSLQITDSKTRKCPIHSAWMKNVPSDAWRINVIPLVLILPVS